ncbi:MAG: AEC family transporter [Candidatus Omnitrophota bacterium]|nr:AEC family transporter [Candidatus Omnitrophota bacterium]
MFFGSLRITASAMAQIFLLGALGYFLCKKGALGEEGLDALSRLTMNITLPMMIFCQLIRDFNFALYQDWWIFPLLSIAITVLGLAVGGLCGVFLRGQQHRLQFLSLVGFQNSGYLPLALFAALLPKEKLDTIFIYLFLFLLGFNLLMFSLGVYILNFSKEKKIEPAGLFSPPVAAVALSLLLVFLGLNKALPEFIFRPMKLLGDSTLPLAMLVVGGNLAQIRLKAVDKKAIALLVAAKLILLPALGILLILKFRLPELIGLLILVELAVPSATTLSVIIRHYKKEDLLISQGIFFSHIFSILTLSLFLGMYFLFMGVR